MIDYFALALIHGLLAIAMLRLVRRDSLDLDPALEVEDKGFGDKGAGGKSAANKRATGRGKVRAPAVNKRKPGARRAGTP